MTAAYNGHTKVVKTLLLYHANLDHRTTGSEGFTALMFACKNGRDQIVRLLLDAGANPNIYPEESKRSPFLLACRSCSEETIRLFLGSGCQVNEADHLGQSSLMRAILSNNISVVKLIIDAGADVNHVGNSDPATPLACAVWKSSLNVLKLLLANGAEVKNGLSSPYETPLIIAARGGQNESIEMLYAAGAELEVRQGDSHVTALFNANMQKSAGITLLKLGANPNIVSAADGWTPLMIAATSGNAGLTNALLEAGAEINHAAFDGSTALAMAIAYSNSEVFEILVNAGAEVNCATNDLGLTPLMWSAIKGNAETLETLLEHGANVDDITTGNDSTPLTKINEHFIGAIVPAAGMNGINMIDAEKGHSALVYAYQLGNDDCVRILREAGAEIDSSTGIDPLYKTCIFGHTETVKTLLSYGELTEESMATALIRCSQDGQFEIVQSLIDAGAPLDFVRVDNGANALCVASQYGHADIVRLLLKQNGDTKRNLGNAYRALADACKNDHFDVAKLLHDYVAKVKQDLLGDGFTALVWASNNGHKQVVEYLLSENENVNQCNSDNGQTALMIASSRGHTGVVQLLLEKQAKVNQRTSDTDGTTSLILAAQNGRTDIVKLLLEHGADTTVLSSEGLTVLMEACSRGCVELVSILLEHGADVDQLRPVKGSTALMLASQNNHIEIVKILLNWGANIEQAAIDSGVTALMLACRYNDGCTAKFLIENGAEVNSTDCNNTTALFYALANEEAKNNIALLKMLVESGADVNQKDSNGNFPWMLLGRFGQNSDIVQILKKSSKQLD